MKACFTFFLLIIPHVLFATEGSLCRSIVDESLLFRSDRTSSFRVADLVFSDFNPDDFFAVRKFIRQARLKLGVDPDLSSDRRALYSDLEFANLYFQDRSGSFGVLRNQMGQVVGTIGFTKVVGTIGFTKGLGRRGDSGEGRKRVCELKKVYLAEELRGRKIGEEIVLIMMRRARAMGFQKMILQTNPKLESAVRLYERIGFERYRTELDNDMTAYYSISLDQELQLFSDRAPHNSFPTIQAKQPN